jgi:hypothetical protein
VKVINRRMFLAGAGGATLSIPFLPSLLSSTAHAGPARKLRYVQIASPFSTTRALFWPNPSSHVPVSPVTQLDETTKRQSLAEIIAATGSIAPGMTGAVWNDLAPYLNVITGTNLNGSNDKHNSTSTTTASSPFDFQGDDHPPNDNPAFPWSVDHFAEAALSSSAHAFRALRTNLVHRHGESHGYLHDEYVHYCFAGPDLARPGLATIVPEMFDAAELDVRLRGAASSAPDDPRRAARQKLIDAVRDDYRGLIAHRRLSALDRARLEAAVELWNEAENRARTTGMCALPDELEAAGEGRASWRDYHHYTMDLLAYALACDLTPVVTYVLMHGGDEFPLNYDQLLELHGGAHGNAENEERYEQMAAWRLDRFAHFGDRLRTLTDESGESLLESTVAYWGHEYADTGAHPHAGHTSILLGKAGGRLDTGNYLDVAGEPTGDDYYYVYENGVPLNRVLFTLVRALGVSQESLEATTGRVGFGEFGDAPCESNDHRPGASFGFSNAGRGRYTSDVEKRKTLPIFRDV